MGGAPEAPFVSLDDLIRARATTHQHETLISYPDHAGNFINFTGSDLESVTKIVAIQYAKRLSSITTRKQPELPAIVGLVGVSTLEYYITFLAIQRLGLSTFFISPRLADHGFEHLLRVTRCTTVIADPISDKTLQRVSRDFDLKLREVPLIGVDALDHALREKYTLRSVENGRSQKFIIHSGGTTGLPKPVTVDASTWLAQASVIAARMPQADTVSTLPLFHSFGLATLLRCLVNGKRLSLMNASRPITASAIIAAVERTSSQAVVTVPYVLKFFAEIDGSLERLSELSQVIVAGSTIADTLAELLLRSRVNIFHLYGLTEYGALMSPEPHRDFRWVSPLPHAKPFLRFEPVADGLYHLIVLPGLKAKVMSTGEDGSYATRDLFYRDRTDPNKWKFAARQDDIIVLSNGEKADPIPLEDAVSQNVNVKAAVVFGAERPALGMISIASEHATALSPEEFIDCILPDLEKGNSRVPAYARISKDALIVKPSSTPYPQTDKHTIVRSRFLQQFAADIEKHYAAEEAASAAGTARSTPEIRDAVREVVLQVLGSEVQPEDLDDEQDFFSLGMDSLQASKVRAGILRLVAVNVPRVSTNAVFEHPNIGLLTQHLSTLLGGVEAQESSPESVARSLIEKYSLATGGHVGKDTAAGISVLLTGATGTIGVHILHQLLLEKTVRHVHCLVRASDSEAAFDRIYDALSRNRLTSSLSPEEHIVKLYAHSSDFSVGNLGLAPPLIAEFKSSLTHIIHDAWSVNFNLSLRSFEEHSIRPTHFLLSLAASSTLTMKPTFTFVSSIAVALHEAEHPVSESLRPWEAVARMGYAQSKFVGEHIAAAASKMFKVRIARVGQVCGDTVHGMWNATEAIPLTVQAATTIHALPKMDSDEQLRWLPADVTGRAIAELTLITGHEAQPLQVVHIVNDSRISWNQQFLPWLRLQGLEFESLPQREWLQGLEGSQQDIQLTPPVKLLDFFRSRYGESKSAGDPVFDTTEAQKLIPALRNNVEVDAELVAKFLRHWRSGWEGYA